MIMKKFLLLILALFISKTVIAADYDFRQASKDLSEKNYINIDRHLTAWDKDVDVFFNQGSPLLSALGKPSNIEMLKNWTESDPNSTWAWTALGRAYYNKAYVGIYGKHTKDVTKENRASFFENLEKANVCTDRACQLYVHNGFAWTLAIHLSVDLKKSKEEVSAIYEKAVRAKPEWYYTYEAWARSLSPKRGGNLEDLKKYVDQVTASAPKGSRLRLLIPFYLETASEMESPPAQFLSQPEVWGSMRAEFEEFLSLHPKDSFARIEYTHWATVAGKKGSTEEFLKSLVK
jgi:hypothetical protein